MLVCMVDDDDVLSIVPALAALGGLRATESILDHDARCRGSRHLHEWSHTDAVVVGAVCAAARSAERQRISRHSKRFGQGVATAARRAQAGDGRRPSCEAARCLARGPDRRCRVRSRNLRRHAIRGPRDRGFTRVTNTAPRRTAAARGGLFFDLHRRRRWQHHDEMRRTHECGCADDRRVRHDRSRSSGRRRHHSTHAQHLVSHGVVASSPHSSSAHSCRLRPAFSRAASPVPAPARSSGDFNAAARTRIGGSARSSSLPSASASCSGLAAASCSAPPTMARSLGSSRSQA
jgi:hypothetical protein